MLLINGNYIDFVELLPSKSVDLVVTDPPYLHNKGHWYQDYANTKSAFAKSALYSFSGKMMDDMNWFGKEAIYSFLNSMRRIMKKMNCYCCCSENQIVYYGTWAQENNFYMTVLVWEKPVSIINKNRFSQNAEYIVRIYEHGTGLRKLDTSDVYNRVRHVRPVLGKFKLHPTEKPIQLMEDFILLSSDKGDVIFDPFMGSGTTGVAALRHNRHFIGVEKDHDIYEVARNRLNYIDICQVGMQ